MRCFHRSSVLLCALRVVLFLPLLGSVSWAATPVQDWPGATINPAVVPEDRSSEGWWATRHMEMLAQAKAHPDAGLLLIGDSITNNYVKSKLPDENFQPTWQQFYAPRGALNLGFSGDTTANVLWRLKHGEVEALHPKAVVLLIGTNNTGWKGQTAEQTEVGIDAVIVELEQRLPGAKILLMGVLPSGISAAKTATDEAVNAYLAKVYCENPVVTFLDISSIFFKDGTLNAPIFYDPRLPQHGAPLHPDTLGQHMMAEAIEPTLATLMGDQPMLPLPAMTEINTALIPVGRLEQDSYDWYARHHAATGLAELALAKRRMPETVMIGDSITHFWAGEPLASQAHGPMAWESLFGSRVVTNLGFGWDRTQNVLWRLRQGELDGIAPRWVVVNIGTNNLTGSSHARANSPEETVAGVVAVVAEVRRRLPQSRLIVMAILPRGTTTASPLRPLIAETNRLLAERFGGDRPGRDEATTYLDVGAKFLAADGTLPVALMPDGTHPSQAGYQIWADALKALGVGARSLQPGRPAGR